MEIENSLRHLLESLRKGEIDVDSAMERMSMLPYEDLGDVKLDWHRSLRRGIGEIIYTPGKSDDQLVKIARSIAEHRSNAIFSRVSKEKYELLKPFCPILNIVRMQDWGCVVLSLPRSGAMWLSLQQAAPINRLQRKRRCSRVRRMPRRKVLRRGGGRHSPIV